MIETAQRLSRTLRLRALTASSGKPSRILRLERRLSHLFTLSLEAVSQGPQAAVKGPGPGPCFRPSVSVLGERGITVRSSCPRPQKKHPLSRERMVLRCARLWALGGYLRILAAKRPPPRCEQISVRTCVRGGAHTSSVVPTCFTHGSYHTNGSCCCWHAEAPRARIKKSTLHRLSRSPSQAWLPCLVLRWVLERLGLAVRLRLNYATPTILRASGRICTVLTRVATPFCLVCVTWRLRCLALLVSLGASFAKGTAVLKAQRSPCGCLPLLTKYRKHALYEYDS